VQPTRVTDRIHQLDGLLGGPALILGDDAVTLVDTGSAGDEEAILAAVEALGRSRSDVRHVLVTHADSDHVGGLAGIVEATGAEVYASALDADVIEGKGEGRYGFAVERAARVARRLEGGETLPIQGGIEVLTTPGHCAGHLSYYLPRERILFAGDCLRNTSGLDEPPHEYTDEPDVARRTIGELASRDVEIAVFGHGPAITSGAGDRLASLARSLSG
jgi:glyoxylase-like metal-dependent hydrolase (beta-lactamase superfamily II)